MPEPPSDTAAPGALADVTVLELAAIGPVPFAAMMLADMGAEVLRIDRVGGDEPLDIAHRSRRSAAVDLKDPAGRELALRLVERADVLVEGFRPGVMERLGLGPDEVHARNERLVFGRMTGWGSGGPYAADAGHDINYIAIAGALDPIGRPGEPPVPPLNLVGDFGGGGMMLALGVCAALLEARRSGRGQVVEAAMVDGAALLTTSIHNFRARGEWTDRREANYVDGGAPYYAAYETADGGHVAVGAMEPKFWSALLDRLGLADDPDFAEQEDRAAWPHMKARLAEVFRTRTRDEWCTVMEGADACFTPVLSMAEAPSHPQNVARSVFSVVDGAVQPSPSPRFSRTPSAIRRPPARAGQHTAEALADWGIPAGDLDALRAMGVIR